MSKTSEAVSIRVLDREYTVGVEPAERDSLIAAARLLDVKMRDVRGANRMAAVDRVAVLAALNLAHELQQLRDDSDRRKTGYRLTETGLALIPVLLEIAAWSARTDPDTDAPPDWIALVESDKERMTRLITDTVREGGCIFVGDDSVLARLAD